MQINNSTNPRNKNLSFQGVLIDSNLAEFGVKFATELKKAEQELKKLYGGKKVDVFIKKVDKEVKGDFEDFIIPTPTIRAEARKIIEKTGTKLVEKPQTRWERFFNKPVKKEKVDSIEFNLLNKSAEKSISPQMKSEEIVETVRSAVAEARKSLHELFNRIYSTSSKRKAKRILEA